MSEYPHEFFNKDKKVVCQICGKAYLVISPRHLGTHKITYSEYKLRFPEAPLSCEEFNVLGKYGKEKQIFVEHELKKLDDVPDEPKIQEIDDDIPENDVEPIIEEEIDFGQILETAKPVSKDICDISKDKILDYLKALFTNIKKDYKIQEFLSDNRMLFEFISDFSDPVLKINIEFPNTFWHNEMVRDLTRDDKLKEHGWKVIRINSKNPTFKNITDAIESL
jgi:very-short-patch-repair endonuclease